MDYQRLIQKVKEAFISEQLVQIETSARHVHLSREYVEQLFGKGYKLKNKRELSQPGQYLCEERVTIQGPKGRFENVAILGPERSTTQVEVSKTDTFSLGVLAPIRESGDIEGTPGITLIGPSGMIGCDSGVIIAKRHIHITPDEALSMGLVDHQVVTVEVLTPRGIIFKEVVVRVNKDFRLRMHVDLDEANAADMNGFTLGKIIK